MRWQLTNWPGYMEQWNSVIRPPKRNEKKRFLISLDVKTKTGGIGDLVAGKQGQKYPVSLYRTDLWWKITQSWSQIRSTASRFSQWYTYLVLSVVITLIYFTTVTSDHTQYSCASIRSSQFRLLFHTPYPITFALRKNTDTRTHVGSPPRHPRHR